MSLASTTVKASYQGNGSNDTFAIPGTPIVDDSAETVVYIRDETDADAITETLQVEGALNDYTLTGAPDASSFHTNVLFNAGSIPTATQKVVIIRQLPLTQTLDQSPNASFLPASQETAFDRVVAQIQQLQEQINRSVRMSVTTQITTNNMLMDEPVANKVIGWNDDATSITSYTFGEIAESFATLVGGVPAGGATGAVLAKVSAADADLEWKDYAYTGYSARFSTNIATTDLDDTLSTILNITYTAPTISLTASGSSTVREKGTAVTSSNLSATVTKLSDPIAAVRFYKASTLINTVASPNPAGGVETYAWSGSFSDTETFKAEVDDNGDTGGPTTVTSNIVTFTYVYPYYYGAGAVGLTPAQVAGLTKDTIVSTASKTVSFTATAGQVFYFAYPATYGALTSILDQNGFETFSDWTLDTQNITGLDTTAQSYRIYEFNNPVAAATYSYTFIR
jgi:hypothetical protein